MKCWEIGGYNGKAGLHFRFLSDSFLELTTEAQYFTKGALLLIPKPVNKNHILFVCIPCSTNTVSCRLV